MISLDATVPLDSFQLEVHLTLSGPTTSLLGPSGSGKTSLLEVLAGLRREARGRISVDERIFLDSSAGRCLPPEARQIGYVPQDALLFPHLDVRGNLEFGLGRGNQAQSRLREITEILEIGDLMQRFPVNLSGGERQRVSLGRALATAPRLLLLDEPLAAVDMDLKDRILPYLLRVRDETHLPMIYVTHHLEEAKALAVETIVLERGRVAQHGPTGEILAPLRLPASVGSAFQNLVEGHLEGQTLEVNESLTLCVPGAPDRSSGRAVYIVAADDVLLSKRIPEEISARNIVPGEVVAVHPIGVDVIVRATAGGLEWLSTLTEAAVNQLSLQRGTKIFVVVKTHSFRRLG